VFITDHNLAPPAAATDTAETAERAERGETVKQYPMICPGIEVSAWRAHIVLLGDTGAVDQRRYNASLDGLLALLRVSDSAYGALSVASLPEYRRNHWTRLDTLIAAGLDGLEIVNASPKANELTRAERDSVISLARRSNRFVVGVSDSHGWGATSMVWNVVAIPAPRQEPRANCGTILKRLSAGFPAVRIIERHRLRSDDWWPLWLTPIGVVWETWRGMDWPLTVAWLVWLWAAAALWRARLRRFKIGP
jgi:hypothetical protein